LVAAAVKSQRKEGACSSQAPPSILGLRIVRSGIHLMTGPRAD
jgi:hypothetical protein